MKYTELNDCEEFYHKVEYYNKTKTEQLSYHYKEILKLLGEDPDREGLVKTPYRVAKAMQFMTRGYHENPEEILRSALMSASTSRAASLILSVASLLMSVITAWSFMAQVTTLTSQSLTSRRWRMPASS